MESLSLKNKNYELKTAQGGQAVIVSVVFFLFISLSLVLGVSSVAVRELKVANEALTSAQGLYAAESGVEDATYRLRRGFMVAATETLQVGSATATTTVADLPGGQKELVAAGDMEKHIRKVRTLLTITTGATFNYGVQVGAGGLSLSNNAGIVGNVYANGPIDGDNGAYITGTAIAANSSTIDDVNIGENGAGNAWAHAVEDSTIAGTNYCTVGSGNNKPCDTSQGDPPAEQFPISVDAIEGWKADAAAGGTIAGNYTVTANASLGPKEITGNLLLSSNNKVLTITGTLYVRGNIDISNGSTIRCAASYGVNSCVVLADGSVHVSNNGVFSGSGAAGSYLLLLTTLRCPGSGTSSSDGKPCGHHNGAIDVHNQATGVIFYAADGMLNLHQGVALSEATAYKIKIENNAAITYESGLADIHFSSGPGGSFDVDRWREVK